MREWNAVISVHENGFNKAREVFGDFGEVSRTEFFNVLLLKADKVREMLDSLRKRWERSPESLDFLARLVPVTHTFTFNTPEEFEVKAKKIILEWAPRLAGASFHVRLRRRGFKGRIRSPDEERLLDQTLIEAINKTGSRGQIEFENPDAVVAIETIGTWAGFLLWTQNEYGEYPFVRV